MLICSSDDAVISLYYYLFSFLSSCLLDGLLYDVLQSQFPKSFLRSPGCAFGQLPKPQSDFNALLHWKESWPIPLVTRKSLGCLYFKNFPFSNAILAMLKLQHLLFFRLVSAAVVPTWLMTLRIETLSHWAADIAS
jgi:hypothetical protein